MIEEEKKENIDIAQSSNDDGFPIDGISSEESTKEVDKKDAEVVAKSIEDLLNRTYQELLIKLSEKI